MTQDDVIAARDYAIAAHADQKYASQPYVVHLDAVATICRPFGPDAMVIAYLHDVAEDTTTHLDALRDAFGEKIAHCVELVTDPPGANRGVRKEKAHAKLSRIKGEDQLALIVKAADRLANLRQAAGGDADSQLGMYRREHPAFRAAAFRPGLCDAIWTEIEAIILGTPNA